MIDLAEAQARLLALAMPVSAETMALGAALGRWTSQPVLALRTQPAHDLSAMDGYAIRFADMPGPWRIVGEAAAGQPFTGDIAPGHAARISTGAALPSGTDSILIHEDAKRDGDTLILTGRGPQRCGESVRKAGEDFASGAVLIDRGVQVSAARLALAAMGGHATIAARRTIRVAIATTGTELVPVGSAPDAGLPDSNAPMLVAQLAGYPVEILCFRVVDSLAALQRLFAETRDVDILVTTGGASVGDHDLVRPALTAAGGDIDFWKIAMRPGKPVMVGRRGNAIVLGLPGNPVSAFVTAELLLKPIVAQLSGAADPLPRPIAARLGAALPAVGARTDFVRMRWADGALVPVRTGDSGALFPLAQAQALAIRPAGAAAAAVGDFVEAIAIA